jgi:hypothetical protein
VTVQDDSCRVIVKLHHCSRGRSTARPRNDPEGLNYRIFNFFFTIA